jgi:hypothetical protein
MIQTRRTRVARVSQGDVFRDIEFIEDVLIEKGELVVTKTTFPLVVVLTQDCDLASDYRIRWSRTETPSQDQQLISALVAPAYNAEQFFEGSHLSELNLCMQRQNSDKKSLIKSSQNQRYHFLQFPANVPLPDSVIDFKHYFSIHVEKLKRLKKGKWVCKIAEMYREDISQRFANYLSRIGLPTA